MKYTPRAPQISTTDSDEDITDDYTGPEHLTLLRTLDEFSKYIDAAGQEALGGNTAYTTHVNKCTGNEWVYQREPTHTAVFDVVAPYTICYRQAIPYRVAKILGLHEGATTSRW